MGLRLKSLQGTELQKEMQPYTKNLTSQKLSPLIYTEGRQISWPQPLEIDLTLSKHLLKQDLIGSALVASQDLFMWTMTAQSTEDKNQVMSFGFTNTVGSTLCLKHYSVYWEENLKDSLQ